MTHAPVPTGRGRKIAISLAVILLAGVLVWGFVAHRGGGDPGESVDSAPTSRVARVGDEAAIVLEPAAFAHANIATVPLHATDAAASGMATGATATGVQLQGEIVANPAHVTTIRAAVPGRLSSAAWPVLGANVSSGQTLGQVSDAKALVAPRSGVVTRVSAQPGELVQAGQELLVLTDFSEPLVRIVWRPELGPNAPAAITVAPVGASFPGRNAQLVGAASDVDSLTRLPVYLYRLRGAWLGARPGTPVTALVPDTRASTMPDTASSNVVVVVPDAAVVQWDALAWAYVARGPRSFVRVRVRTDHPVAGGYVVSAAASGLKSGDEIVVRGAQQLLSEEFRTHVQTGDADDEKKR